METKTAYTLIVVYPGSHKNRLAIWKAMGHKYFVSLGVGTSNYTLPRSKQEQPFEVQDTEYEFKSKLRAEQALKRVKRLKFKAWIRKSHGL